MSLISDSHGNIYGHNKRLQILLPLLSPQDIIVEFGCGTGYMITLPLLRLGYDAIGVDMDAPSIEYGRNVLREEGLPEDRLRCIDLRDLDLQPDCIIASEVLEHIPDDELEGVVAMLTSKLNTGGTLLITVPNGYGWFEAESWLWNSMTIGRLLERLRIVNAIIEMKKRIGIWDHAEMFSTLSSSPHVQRFTMSRICLLLERHGLRIEQRTGTVFFCGPFSHLFFSGVRPVTAFNLWLGSLLPDWAAGFIVVCRKPGELASQRIAP
ncbi:MAG: class I SAM-dependent methyltransferase [Desulfomonile tiedjei]|uniref:Class I SAM-dependent methyltransferase n=1 Tax=Desulfomonile tiedjei TaxID=2358 RepID=A0A9D6Z1W5_9BACT|nr:class I SAM-dependent methyltransferase [Desulfomonile tiedjei]